MALHSKKQQKARALKMLEAKVLHGKTNAQIARDFGVTPDTVKKALTLAEKADIIVSFEDRLMSELLPLAHEAVMGALQEGNAKIGLAVLQGTQVLRPAAARTQSQQLEDDELARYIAQKRLAAQIAADTLDGQIVAPSAPKELPHAQQALPAGNAGALPSSPEGDRPQDLLQSPQSEQLEAAGTAPSGAGGGQPPETHR